MTKLTSVLAPLLLALACLGTAHGASDVDRIRQKLEGDLSAEEKAYYAKRAACYDKAIQDLAKVLAKAKPKSEVREEGQAAMRQFRMESALAKDPALRLAHEYETYIGEKRLTKPLWDACPGDAIAVKADEAMTTLKVTLEAGQCALIVPNPEDTWKHSPTAANDYKGDVRLLAFVKEAKQPGLTVEGPGQVQAGPDDEGLFDNSGAIRVKVLVYRKPVVGDD